MKKLFSTTIALLFTICTAFSADLSDFQKKTYGELSKFLSEEGFSASIDNSDGTLTFKKEGELHWIYVSKEQLFITVNRAGFKIGGEDSFDYEKSIRAANEINKELTVVKVYCSQTSAKVSYELYAKSIEDFKFVFYKAVELLNSARKMFLETYQSEEQSAGRLEMSSIVNRDSFLPIYGIDFNTTKEELDKMGYKERKFENGVYKYYFENVWAYCKEGKVNKIILGEHDTTPQTLVKLGFDEPKSYNEWVKFVEALGFTGIDYSDKKIDKDNFLNAWIIGENKELKLKISMSLTGFDLPTYDTKLKKRPYIDLRPI